MFSEMAWGEILRIATVAGEGVLNPFPPHRNLSGNCPLWSCPGVNSGANEIFPPGASSNFSKALFSSGPWHGRSICFSPVYFPCPLLLKKTTTNGREHYAFNVMRLLTLFCLCYCLLIRLAFILKFVILNCFMMCVICLLLRSIIYYLGHSDWMWNEW